LVSSLRSEGTLATGDISMSLFVTALSECGRDGVFVSEDSLSRLLRARGLRNSAATMITESITYKYSGQLFYRMSEYRVITTTRL